MVESRSIVLSAQLLHKPKTMKQIYLVFISLFFITLVADAQNNIGIGIATPAARLDIKGVGSTSATNALIVRNSGGTVMMVVNNAGNVGIGTPSPSRQLHIYSSAGLDVLEAIESNNPSGNPKILFQTPGQQWEFGTDNSASDMLRLTSGTFGSGITVFTATTTGNVGIGTVSSGAKLEVNGAIKITDGTQGANKVLTSDNNGLASWQSLSIPQDEIVVVTMNGVGSVNTNIPRFSSVLTNSGSAMTYVDSPTDGATVTINTAGIYFIRFTVKSVWNDNNSCYLGLLKNTATMPAITSANQLSYMHNYETASTTYPIAYSEVYLQVGDVIRPWGNQAAGNEARFEIRRIH